MPTEVFYEKSTFFVSYIKTINFDAKKGFSRDFFLSFLHRSHKMLVSHEIYRTHINVEIYAPIFYSIYLTYQNIISDDKNIYTHVSK